MKVNGWVLAALMLLPASNAAHAAAGASISVNSISCQVGTPAGPVAVPAAGFECGAQLFGGFGGSFADGLQIRASVTLSVFDEGLPGAQPGTFSPWPFNPFVSGFVPAGFEWAGASVLVGRQQDPRSANPFIDYTFQTHTLRTTQDAVAESFSETLELTGMAFLTNGPQSLSGGFASVGVFPITAWQVSPIPEPPVYAFLVAGLAMLGFVLSHRRAFDFSQFRDVPHFQRIPGAIA
jgi:PEP-CTERM motif.